MAAGDATIRIAAKWQQYRDYARADKIYEAREKMWTEANLDMREFERVALLGAVDNRWMDHIDAMDQLRDGIGLRAYGQKNPITEYKREGYDMFEEMVHLIQEDTLRRLYFAVLVRQQPAIAFLKIGINYLLHLFRRCILGFRTHFCHCFFAPLGFAYEPFLPIIAPFF